MIGYLDNGHVRIGVDLDKGGAITYLAREQGPNLVNDFDLGRQIQMSYYSGPVPFAPNGKPPRKDWAGLGWNPIQSGDCYGHPSKMLAYRNDGRQIYLKCVPMQWPLDDVPGECAFESWIRLDGDTVHVRNRIVNRRSDRTQYPGRTQELPAIYTNGPWYRLFTYRGDKPFTGDALTQIPQHPWGPSGPWSSWQATESWAALVDDSGEGLGIWEPGLQAFSGGFAGQPGAGGPKDSPTGYIAPNSDEILDWNVRYDDDYVLILGSLDRIRAYVYAHAAKPAIPAYRFQRDRQHWRYVDAVDAGWPIRGELRLRLERNDPQMIGPLGLWAASAAPKLYIRGAFRTSGRAQLFWSRFDDPGFDEAKSVTFPVVPDGRVRVYEVDLAASPEYRGQITRLRFDPEPGGHPGDEARISYIGFQKP